MLGTTEMSRLLLIITILYLCNGCARGRYVPENGDVIFQTSRSTQSQAIQLATHSEWSHMGIVYLGSGKAYVLEAVQPVKLTPLAAWIRRGVGDHYVVKRLRDASAVLTPKVLEKMRSVGERFVGHDYDPYFEWSDDRIYCSELVWKVYMRGAGVKLSSLRQMRDFDLSDSRVKAKIRERYGEHPPLDEDVVSPSDIYNSKALTTIYTQ